jgi:hypothetical protein
MSTASSENRLMSTTSRTTNMTTDGAVRIDMGQTPGSEKKRIPHSEDYGDPYWIGTCYKRGAAAQEWEIADP